MEYLVFFLSLLLYFWNRYGMFVLVPLVYSGVYFAIRWLGVKNKVLCLGLTLLCIPILFWLLLVRRNFFMADNASELWAMVAGSLSRVFTPSLANPWSFWSLLSMGMGLILCTVGIVKKRRMKQDQAAARDLPTR